jgi:hypothetical protein
MPLRNLQDQSITSVSQSIVFFSISALPILPIFPPSGPSHWLLQEPPEEIKLLAASSLLPCILLDSNGASILYEFRFGHTC